MLSLAYRIATIPCHTIKCDSVDRGYYDERIGGFRDSIKSAAKVDLSNVANYYATDSFKGWSFADIPNWAPPFDRLFAEWIKHYPDGNKAQWGVLVQSAEVCDFDESVKWWQFCRLPGVKTPATEGTAALTKWLLHITYWFTIFEGEARGRPYVCGFETWLMVSPTGKGLGCGSVVAFGDHQESHIQTITLEMLDVLGLGISFMHCKNVRQVEEQRDQGDRWHRQYKTPRYTYRRLLIDPMKEVLRREGKSEEVGLQRALHICRGHFATYSEDKPLFGKRAGTFWIPDHVRGSKEAGEVQKDYTVAAPKES